MRASDLRRRHMDWRLNEFCCEPSELQLGALRWVAVIWLVTVPPPGRGESQRLPAQLSTSRTATRLG